MPRQRGSLYVLSLGVSVFLAVVAGSLLTRSISALSVAHLDARHAAAFHLAEAAADRAVQQLQTQLADDIPVTAMPLGSYWAEVETLGALRYRVTGHGLSAASQRDVEVIVDLTPRSAFQYAMFGDVRVDVSGDAVTDSYDSRLGSYDGQPAGANGDVGTNSTSPGGVSVGGSIGVNGQVVVGPTSDPESVVMISGGAVITGDPPIVAQGDTTPLDTVTVPPGLTCNDYSVGGNTTVILEASNGPYCYNNLTVNGGGTLTADGPVTVYLTGELRQSGNTVVGVASDPTQMFFQVASLEGATLEGTITGNSQFHGALYGPGATFSVTGNAEVFGSIIAKDVDVSGSAELHYDEALGELEFGGQYTPSVTAWREL